MTVTNDNYKSENRWLYRSYTIKLLGTSTYLVFYNFQLQFYACTYLFNCVAIRCKDLRRAFECTMETCGFDVAICWANNVIATIKGQLPTYCLVICVLDVHRVTVHVIKIYIILQKTKTE